MAELIKKKLQESKLPTADVQPTGNSHPLFHDRYCSSFNQVTNPKATPRARQDASGALCTLSANEGNDQRLIDAGFHISSCLLLLDPKAHPTPRAKEYAARALAHLALNAENHPYLVAAGVHVSLNKLLADPRTSPRAKKNAARAFGLIAPLHIPAKIINGMTIKRT